MSTMPMDTTEEQIPDTNSTNSHELDSSLAANLTPNATRILGQTSFVPIRGIRVVPSLL